MKPASLKQHLENAHPSMMSKNRSFFESKLSSLKRQKLDQTGMFWRTNKAAVHASYAIALHVAKTKKPHNIGETLLKPCILESGTFQYARFQKGHARFQKGFTNVMWLFSFCHR